MTLLQKIKEAANPSYNFRTEEPPLKQWKVEQTRQSKFNLPPPGLPSGHRGQLQAVGHGLGSFPAIYSVFYQYLGAHWSSPAPGVT
ncbi:hypothetical protein MHYP_G00241580 [Metynnis hypsauchen]